MNTQTGHQQTAGHDDDAALASDPHGDPETTLAKAIAALEAGDCQHGANLVYQAAVQAVRAAAGRLGMPSDTREQLKAVVYKLDGFDPEESWQAYLADPTITLDLPLYSGYFSVAESFKEHAEIPLEGLAHKFVFAHKIDRLPINSRGCPNNSSKNDIFGQGPASVLSSPPQPTFSLVTH